MRSFPDITFVDADLLDPDKVVASMVAGYESRTGRTLYPADPMRLAILWAADIIIHDRIVYNDSARQNVPRYANGTKLDSLGELFKDVSRLGSGAALTTLRFTITGVLAFEQLIPVGTRVSTLDGKVIFETTADAYVTAGNLYVDVTAQCRTAGTVGNGFVAGQIATILDSFPNFYSVANTDTSDGGAGTEEDDEYYERMRESEDAYTTAGSEGAYVYWAKTVSADIIDAVADCETPGVADIRILLTGGALPEAGIIAQVLAALSADEVRPMTDSVLVDAPDASAYNIVFTYYIPDDSSVSPTVVVANVAAAVEEYVAWQCARIGRDINPDELISRVMAAGAKRLVVTSPVYTAVAKKSVAVLGTTAVTNGGVEVG
jgi:phage-related baseplate assembly protein